MLGDYIQEIRALLQDACKKCKSETIALSGGLDSSIISYELRKKGIKGVTLISEDFVATDLTYCQMISKKIGIPLQIIKASTLDLIKGVEETVKILGNFNDIEIRNNVVMFLVMDWLKKKGKKDLITGDGADELFAGYSFLLNKTENELASELERIREIMHFPSQKIAKSLGIKLVSPFLDETIIEISKKIPANNKVKEQGDKRYGKWILRKTYEDVLPLQIVWREKSPMQEGAGTVGLTSFFESLIPDKRFEEKKKEIKEKEGVTIRSKESLQYYEFFRSNHDPPSKLQDSSLKCPYCLFKVEKNSKFCRMCGAFPI